MALGFGPQQVGLAPPQGLVIDAMGEIRLEYPDSLLKEILESGMNAVQITLGNPGLQGPEAWPDVLGEIEAFDRHLERPGSPLRKVLSPSDLGVVRERGQLGIVYYLQNAAPLQDRLERLGELRERGVRSIQLTYNTRNLLGDGCLERVDAGLSHFGLEVVERMNELRMPVDLSHCGPRTALDGIAFSRLPVTINHAGCQAVFDHPRNKSDAILRRLADRGGVIGIYQINPYLGPRERNTLEDYLDHVDHAVRIAGIDHVAIGSDREHQRIPDTVDERQRLQDELDRLKPGTSTPVQWPFFLSELNHPRRMETIRRGLEGRGYATGQIEKILGENIHRLWREAWQE